MFIIFILYLCISFELNESSLSEQYNYRRIYLEVRDQWVGTGRKSALQAANASA